MTNDDLIHRLCLMLAFQTMIVNGKASAKDVATKIVALAKQMDEFCGLHAAQAFSETGSFLADDKGAAKVDDSIATYLEEIKTTGSTSLPLEKETLIQLYDRLQLRKSRRFQWQFYATAKEEKLRDLVTYLLEEEIEDLNAGVPQ